MKTSTLLNEKLELVAENSSLKIALKQKSGNDLVGDQVGLLIDSFDK